MPRRRTLRSKRAHKRRQSTRRQSRQGGGAAQPTFHIFIPSGGRTSVKRLLDSLKGQLKQGDAVTLVFDGKKAYEKSGFQPSWFDGFIATTCWKVHDPPIGKWSHGLANEYQEKLTPETTFVMHADDDDRYTEGAFDELRVKCINPQCLYIAKMKNIQTGETIPRYPMIVFGNIGTPCGIIPFSMRNSVQWGLHFGGDFTYYDALSKVVECVEFLPTIHYEVIRDQGDVVAQGGAKAQLNPTL